MSRKIPSSPVLVALLIASAVIATTVRVAVRVTFVAPGIQLELGTKPVIPEGSNCYLQEYEVICV